MAAGRAGVILIDASTTFMVIVLVGLATIIRGDVNMIGAITAISATTHPADTSISVGNALAVGVVRLGRWIAGWRR